jgi:hypothetical protein
MKFVRNGKVGESKNFFSDELIEEFIKVHGSALKRLGYLNNDSSRLEEEKVDN